MVVGVEVLDVLLLGDLVDGVVFPPPLEADLPVAGCPLGHARALAPLEATLVAPAISPPQDAKSIVLSALELAVVAAAVGRDFFADSVGLVLDPVAFVVTAVRVVVNPEPVFIVLREVTNKVVSRKPSFARNVNSTPMALAVVEVALVNGATGVVNPDAISVGLVGIRVPLT